MQSHIHVWIHLDVFWNNTWATNTCLLRKLGCWDQQWEEYVLNSTYPFISLELFSDYIILYLNNVPKLFSLGLSLDYFWCQKFYVTRGNLIAHRSLWISKDISLGIDLPVQGAHVMF